MDAFVAEVNRVDGSAPFTVDLVEQQVRCPDGRKFTFRIAPNEREALLEGLDDVGFTLKHANEINEWEKQARQARPWLQEMVERPAKDA
jgi:3-isopropylmalate/(R)-2-methylmalate dehydratase small subunit